MTSEQKDIGNILAALAESTEKTLQDTLNELKQTLQKEQQDKVERAVRCIWSRMQTLTDALRSVRVREQEIKQELQSCKEEVVAVINGDTKFSVSRYGTREL